MFKATKEFLSQNNLAQVKEHLNHVQQKELKNKLFEKQKLLN